MASLIKIYDDNPTAGATDGTLVSSGDGSNPIASGVLKANENEVSDPIKLAVRCDTEYQTVEEDGKHAALTIEDSASVDKWKLALTSEGLSSATWGAGLDITTLVDDTNTIFYAQARAVDTEDPVEDTTVDIKVAATVGSQ